MTTRTYTVTGMTRGHCVHAVTEEVGEVPASATSPSTSTPGR